MNLPNVDDYHSKSPIKKHKTQISFNEGLGLSGKKKKSSMRVKRLNQYDSKIYEINNALP